MKVIVNNQTSLIVEDEKGNVLFQHLPQQQLETKVVVNIDNYPSDDEIKTISDKIYRKINNNHITKTRL